MKTLPAIGSRVRYRSRINWEKPRVCVGVVVKHYLGGDEGYDEETGEHYVTPHHVAVQVDKPLPKWWAYGERDRFAPDIAEVEIIG